MNKYDYMENIQRNKDIITSLNYYELKDQYNGRKSYAYYKQRCDDMSWSDRERMRLTVAVVELDYNIVLLEYSILGIGKVSDTDVLDIDKIDDGEIDYKMRKDLIDNFIKEKLRTIKAPEGFYHV